MNNISGFLVTTFSFKAPAGDTYLNLLDKGRSLAQQKQLTESISVFNRVLEMRPYDALPHFYLGACYQNSDDQYRAMHHYTKALELDPHFTEAYSNIGKLYEDFDGDIKSAITYLEMALTHVKDSKALQMLYLNLIRLNQQIADFERCEYYQDLLVTDTRLMGFSPEE